MIDPQLIEIPTFKLTIPDANIDWAYQQYTSLLLDVVEASLENVPGELSNIWAEWQNLHQRIWGSGFDLVTAMGYSNVLAGEKSHELAYGRTLYVGYRTVFEEALRSKNLRLYLSTRISIEKARQLRHIQEQGLQMEFSTALVEASVKAFSLAVQEYNALIKALTLEGKRYDAIIAGNEVILKQLDLALREAELESELFKGDIRRQRALLGVRQAEAEVERMDVEIRLNAVRLMGMQLEVEAAAIRALLVGTQIIEEQAQALSLQVDAQVIAAESDILAVYAAQNEQIAEEITNIGIVKSARDEMYAEALANKVQLIAALTAAQENLATRQTEYANAQMLTNTAKNNLAIENMTSADLKDDAEFNYSYNKEFFSDELAKLRVDMSLLEKTLAMQKDARETDYRKQLADGEKQAAELLKNAKIINRFTEYR